LVKSIFVKYISIFMAIIIVCFFLLAVIVGSTVVSYSTDARKTEIQKAADESIDIIYSFMEIIDKDFESVITDHNSEIRRFFSMQSKNSEIDLFITDTKGRIIISNNKLLEGASLPPNVVQDVMNNANHHKMSDLGGFFDSSHLNVIYRLQEDKDIIGTFIVSSETTMINDLLEKIAKTAAVTMLWVLLAALITVYVLSEKITKPLKEMSRAAKLIAQGNFDVRVPVRGKDEIAELSTAFNNMTGSCGRLEEMRKTFLANVSHDLRTPMTSIAGFIDGILDGTIPPERHKHYLQIISNEIRRLSRLVNSLLDISKMQAGEKKLIKTNFDICELARQVIISLEKPFEKKELDVQIDFEFDSIKVFSDSDAIYQVLFNLCDNAIKFSDQGGTFKLSIKQKSEKVYVSVFNTGTGIEKEDLPYVFERFYKSDRSRGLDKSGAGLGLFIVKTIVEGSGEEIWVKSEYGKNCEFIFSIEPAVDK